MFISLIVCAQPYTGSPTVCIISQTVTFFPILLTGSCSKIFKNIQTVIQRNNLYLISALRLQVICIKQRHSPLPPFWIIK